MRLQAIGSWIICVQVTLMENGRPAGIKFKAVKVSTIDSIQGDLPFTFEHVRYLLPHAQLLPYIDTDYTDMHFIWHQRVGRRVCNQSRSPPRTPQVARGFTIGFAISHDLLPGHPRWPEVPHSCLVVLGSP